MPPTEEKDPAGTAISRVDQFLEPLFTDPTLRPLLIVLATCFVTFGTALVLLAARSRSLFAMASVVILVLMSVESVQRDVRRREFAATTRIVLGFWAGSLLCAGGVVWMGWF